jgi:hypothetical protein
VDGLSRAAGAGTEIELNGKNYQFSPLQFSDIGVIENNLLKERPNPLIKVAEAREHLPEDLFRELLNVAYQDVRQTNRITEQEFNDYIGSREGQVYVLWLSLKHCNPEMTLEFVQEAIQKMSAEKFNSLQRTISIGTGVDELGNSTGDQPDVPVVAPETKTTGGTSTDSLPASTSGDQTSSTS